MQHMPPDSLPAAPSSWTHRINVRLGVHPRADQLRQHVDNFMRLYLDDLKTIRSFRLGEMDYALRLADGASADLEQIRQDIASRLFGPEEEALVHLSDIPTGQTAPMRADLDSFRNDIRTIARSLHGQSDLKETLVSFQSELQSLSSTFRDDLTDAVTSIQDAAERVEIASAMIPDPDRLELLMTRNEASAVILERGVRQSLELILEAVDALALKGLLPHRITSDDARSVDREID